MYERLKINSETFDETSGADRFIKIKYTFIPCK